MANLINTNNEFFRRTQGAFMLRNSLCIVTLVICCFSLSNTYARLAKQATVGGSVGTSTNDISSVSRYAQSNDNVINLLTGSPSYNMKLFSITSKTGLNYDINLSYNGASQSAAIQNNTLAPTGYAGLCWNLGNDAIIVDSKRTGTISDDEYFLKEANGQISEIIRTGNSYGTYSFQIKSHPYWKITVQYTTPTSTGWQNIYSWLFTLPNGTKLQYGGTWNSGRFVAVDDNGKFDPSFKQKFYYQWDLESITDVNHGSITFKYEQTKELWNNRWEEIKNGEEHAFAYDYGWGNKFADLLGGTIIDSYWYVVAKMIEAEDDPNGYCINGNTFERCDNNTAYCKCGESNPSVEDGTKGEGEALDPSEFNKMWIKRKWVNYWTMWAPHPAWGPKWKWYVTTNEQRAVCGENVISSYLREIISDNGESVLFEPIPKDKGELGSRSLHEEAVCIGTITFSKGSLDDRINFIYSGMESQLPHLNEGTNNEKRLLIGITSSVRPEAINRIFEYSQQKESVGLLTKVEEPITGKSTHYEYTLHDIQSKQNGKKYRVSVVEKVIKSSGDIQTPDITTTYSYTTNSNEQEYDTSSAVPYFGMVTGNSSTGKIVTIFETDEETNLFGLPKRIEVYNTSTVLVSSIDYEYTAKAYGPADNEWYLPVLKKSTSITDQVASVNGVSICDGFVDENSGKAKQHWIKTPDGKYLVTSQTFAYEDNSDMGTGLSGKNMFTQTASGKLIQVSSYDQSTCDISNGIVMKAWYTVWDNAASMNIEETAPAIWRPAAEYVWNSPKNSSGSSTIAFQDFDKDHPTANGWQLKSGVEKYDNYGRVVQVRSAHDISTTRIICDKYDAPIASIANSSFEDCAIYTCAYDMNENGFFDYFNKWQKGAGHSTIVGGSSLNITNINKHFGQKSLYVKNSSGPMRKVFIRPNTDYVFSAWIYPVTNNTIKFGAEVHIDNESIISHDLSISINTLTMNKWQLVNLSIPLASLEDIQPDDNNRNDYVQIWIGNSSNMAASEFYVDDIRFYPEGALVTTTYYDDIWFKPICTADANSNPSTFTEYDSQGKVSKIYRLNKDKNNGDADGKVLITHNNYQFMGEQLRVVTPNGGEKLLPGQDYLITWSGPSTIGTNGVDIYYYNGTNWSLIESSIKGNNSLKWIVPSNASNCKIKIQSQDNTSISDQSDDVFSISDYLMFTSPSESDVWWSGRNLVVKHNINWNSTGGSVTNVSLEYFDGKNWKMIIENTPNNGSYVWGISDLGVGAGLTRLRISESGTSNYATVSPPFKLNYNCGALRRIW